ncbi:ZIP family metal transporter [Candidatus Acetothermia bacterium]|nr:ZIP family metal transporter [Candidatus Acetothermia bacterium]MBI3644265.1 ZIP family metal transporter [Candidatus Acetothermia bacterium]
MGAVSALYVFWYALITAIATGFGAIPFLIFRKITSAWIGVFNAIAGGLMLAASFSLIYEGANYDLVRVMIGVLIGLFFILASHKLIKGRDDLKLGALQGVDAKKAVIIVGIMTLHSFTEGVGIGVSFGGGAVLGIFITIAIAVHNIPEGLAISSVLVPRGVSIWKSSLWSIFSSLPQPLMAVPAFLFVEAFRPILPVGLGFAGGAMIWMVYSEILPDALKETSSNTVAITMTLSIAAMITFQVFLKLHS